MSADTPESSERVLPPGAVPHRLIPESQPSAEIVLTDPPAKTEGAPSPPIPTEAQGPPEVTATPATVPLEEAPKHAPGAAPARVTRIRWVRALFWISWPVATFLTAVVLLMVQGTPPEPANNLEEVEAEGRALGLLLSAGVFAGALVGIPCAFLEVLLVHLRKRKDPSLRVPSRAFVLPGFCLLLWVGGGLIFRSQLDGVLKDVEARPHQVDKVWGIQLV